MVFALAFWSLICTISNQACEHSRGGKAYKTAKENTADLWLFFFSRGDDEDKRAFNKTRRTKVIHKVTAYTCALWSLVCFCLKGGHTEAQKTCDEYAFVTLFQFHCSALSIHYVHIDFWILTAFLSTF